VQERLTQLFESLRAGEGIEPSPRLVFRDGGAAGANAFALPSGLVVVTDAFVALAGSEAELAAVLAHELGHVRHRHALRSLLQDAGVGVLIAGALGDFVSISSLAATLPTLLVELQYSRRFESEADLYAVALLERRGLPAAALADALERLERAHGGDALPSYLSTHPATGRRVRVIRKGARG
jgi:Zn-dependent protease with chaperone function